MRSSRAMATAAEVAAALDRELGLLEVRGPCMSGVLRLRVRTKKKKNNKKMEKKKNKNKKKEKEEEQDDGEEVEEEERRRS